MKPEIIFFDIDGTLVDMDTREISPRTLEALRSLKRQGIKICLCTGRSPMTVPDFGIEFDACLTYNASLCLCGKETVYSSPLDKKEVRRLIGNAASLGRPVCAASDDSLLVNGTDQDLIDYYAFSKTVPSVTEDFEERLEAEDIYQIMLGARKEEYEALMEGIETLKIAAWWDRAVDIVPACGGKGKGVHVLLDHFGIDPENAAAFGDGGNDLEMIQAVGHGIAMGNASPILKEAAREICRPVSEEGIYFWCLKNGLIDSPEFAPGNS